MKKVYLSLYSFILIFVFILLTGIFVFDIKNSQKHYFPTTRFTEWTDYTIETQEKKVTYKGTIQVSDTGNSLVFFTSHIAAKVYSNGKLIYQYPVVNTNPFSVSPGYSLNSISLPYENNEIEIVLSSPYDGYIENAPSFLLGDSISVFGYIIHKDFFSFIICILIFVFGACMVLCWIYLRIKTSVKPNLLFLGIFAILLSIWSINELTLSVLIMKNNIVSSYLSFITLALCPLAYAQFVRSYSQDEHKIWDIFCIMNIFQIITCILLQVFKICDLKHTLWTTHIAMASLIFIVLARTMISLKKGNISANIKIHLFCIIICTICITVDFILFCSYSIKHNIYYRFGFALYIIILGFSTIKESINLMQLGKKAEVYRNLAFTDQTTKLNNRTAFNTDFEQLSLTPEDVCIINFDLNNLKKINDTKGHAFGDLYITSAANIISDTFSKYAKCYRVGGDEFIVIITQYSKFNLLHYLNILNTKIQDFNSSQDDFNLQIAYGYACYNPELDSSLNNTNSRADKYMYEDKIRKKQGNQDSQR